MRQVFFALLILIFGCNSQEPVTEPKPEPVDTTEMVAGLIDSVYQTVQDFVIERTKLNTRGQQLKKFEAAYAQRDTNYYSTLNVDFSGVWGLDMGEGESMLFASSGDTAVEAKYDPVKDQLFVVNRDHKIEFKPRRKNLSVFEAVVLDTSYIFAEVPTNGKQRVFFSLNGNKTLIKR